MLEQSGYLGRLKALIVRGRYRRWVKKVDAVIFVGSGVAQNYRKYTHRFITTAAVWLNDGDLATEIETIKKFQDVNNTIRFCLPSRLTRWKGIDDAISAFKMANASLPRWNLDIIGDGPELEKLRSQATTIDNISFIPPLDYGEAFFSRLRTYHVIVIPTRGLEEARIAFDAAASGCAILHSNTSTLRAALSDIKTKWQFEPGDVPSLAAGLIEASRNRDCWMTAALEGLAAMKGRTIQEMHQRRYRFFQSMMPG